MGALLVVPDQRYAVDAGSSAGRTQVDLVGDPPAPSTWRSR
jgi:hypothetical protein